jgi:hypothetical protein
MPSAKSKPAKNRKRPDTSFNFGANVSTSRGRRVHSRLGRSRRSAKDSGGGSIRA